MTTAGFQFRQIPVLLGGAPDSLKDWAARWEARRVLGYIGIMTTLRPLIGKADTLLPVEKKFFLSHWRDCTRLWDESKGNESAQR